jgi:small subunit ribosomal protein S1
MHTNDDQFWAEIEAEQKRLKRVPNKNVKTRNGDKVFYHGPDAQELYNMYFGYIENFKKPEIGKLTEATIVNIVDDTAEFDLGYREYGYMDLKKESAQYREYFNVGTTLSVKVGENKKQKFLTVSFTDSVNEMKHKELVDSIGKPFAYKAKVEELVSGGYMLDIDGIKVFMPGSLAGLNKLIDFNSLIGKELPVMAVNYSKDKNTIVVSHRQYLHSLVPDAISEIKSAHGQSYRGFVTGSTQYGIFCEFNDCLTGMIHASDLTDDVKELHKNGLIKPGMELEFYIKEIISNFKIILTQFYKESPWESIEDRYKPSQIVTGKISSIKEYGAFIEIEPGISGLLHVSEINKSLKSGDSINIRINKIDKVNKKIYLSSVK